MAMAIHRIVHINRFPGLRSKLHSVSLQVCHCKEVLTFGVIEFNWTLMITVTLNITERFKDVINFNFISSTDNQPQSDISLGSGPIQFTYENPEWWKIILLKLGFLNLIKWYYIYVLTGKELFKYLFEE